MIKLSVFLFAITMGIILHSAQAQSFTFTIASPVANELSDSTLSVAVKFYASTFELSKIIAVTEGRADTLDFAGNNGTYSDFTGSVNLSGLVQGGTFKVKVTCRDVMGNEKSDSVNYLYANPPKARMIYPASGSNTWPSLRIKTSHTGVDTCTSTVNIKIGAQTVFTWTSVYNDIDTTITLNSALNGNGTINLAVKDKWQQQSIVSTAIVADSYLNYLYLTPVYTGSGKILSYNYDKILEARSDALYIVDSGFQTASAIPGTYTIPSTGTLTAYGAVWSSREWTNGVLYNNTYTSAAGKYGIYTSFWSDIMVGSGYDLYRRELGSRSDVLVERTMYNGLSKSTVYANGTVLYLQDYNAVLEKYKNGNISYIEMYSQPIGIDDEILSGDTILYSKINLENYYTVLYMHDGTSKNVLSDIGIANTFFADAASFYAVAGKYIAYVKLGTTGQLQIWLRDSTGNSVQKTFFGSSSYVAGLSPSGDMLFTNNSKLYYLKKDSINAREIGPVVAPPFYKNNTWYLIKNNSLYKININAYRTAASGNWSNPASWQYGTVPLANADVIVDTNIIVDNNFICNTIKVIPPGSITVLPGVNLTVLH